MKTINLVHHGHVERSCSGSLLLVSADVHIVMIVPTVGEPVNQPGIAVIGENDRLIDTEHRIKVKVRDSVRMLRWRLQRHEIDYIDDANLDVREMLPKQIHGGQRFESWHIAGA